MIKGYLSSWDCAVVVQSRLGVTDVLHIMAESLSIIQRGRDPDIQLYPNKSPQIAFETIKVTVC